MEQRNNEKFIMFIITAASVGLIAEIILMGWEFWFPSFVLVGLVATWGVSLSEKMDLGLRKRFYIGFAAMLVFYHGIHKTSFFDTGMTVIFVLATFSILNSVYMMHIILLEYFIILFIHIINLPGSLDYLSSASRIPS